LDMTLFRLLYTVNILYYLNIYFVKPPLLSFNKTIYSKKSELSGCDVQGGYLLNVNSHGLLNSLFRVEK
jgi:hypothetical protein